MKIIALICQEVKAKWKILSLMQTQILKSLNKKDSKAIETLQIQKSVICQSNLLNLFKKE